MFVSVELNVTVILPASLLKTILPFAVVARSVVVVDPRNGLTVIVAV
jgi:hypothetical protein